MVRNQHAPAWRASGMNVIGAIGPRPGGGIAKTHQKRQSRPEHQFNGLMPD
jgi:hypothetical protein